MDTHSIDARLAEIARANHGIITTSAAAAAAIPPSCLQRRWADGRLQRIASGVHAWGYLSDHGRLAAALAVMGPTSAFSHTTSLALRGLWSRGDERLHVVTFGKRESPPSLGIVGHRSASAASDVISWKGLRLTATTRAIAESAVLLTPHQLAHAMYRCSYERALDVDDITGWIAARPGRRGIAVLRRALELHQSGCAGTRSRTEDRFLDAVLRRRIDEPVINTPGAAGIGGYECDFVWTNQRVAVEIDGGGHDLPGARVRDEGQDAALRAAGWRVIRIRSGRVWHELDPLMAELTSALGPRPSR